MPSEGSQSQTWERLACFFFLTICIQLIARNCRKYFTRKVLLELGKLLNAEKGGIEKSWEEEAMKKTLYTIFNFEIALVYNIVHLILTKPGILGGAPFFLQYAKWTFFCDNGFPRRIFYPS